MANANYSQHQRPNNSLSEINHMYGDNYHILSSPVLLSLLAKLGHKDSRQPELNHLLKMIYEHLIDYAIDSLFPKKHSRIETRMKTFHIEAFYEGESVDPDSKGIVVDLARAGTFPSHICFDKLNYLLHPENVRQDHFYIARECDEKGTVTGVNVSGSKIGGDVESAIVIFPDPMGATGSSIVEVYNHYKSKVGGTPKLMIAIHLIITPEYLKNIKLNCPDLHVFAVRLDRGLSPEAILKDIPGKNWDFEKGLNDHQYIVPGAGGLGELLNNSYC